MNPEIAQDAEALKKFIQASSKVCQELLRDCYLATIGDELLITCPSLVVQKALYLRHRRISKIAHRAIAVQSVTYLVGSKKRVTLPTNTNELIQPMLQDQSAITAPQGIIAIPDLDLYQELANFPGSATAVRFFDDSGIANNERVEATSGVHANDWVRVRNQDFWMPGELTSFKQRLLQDKKITNYSYTAFLVNGIKCRFTVDARLALVRGQLTRIVKVNDCVPVI
jgi:hypothetical protein